MKTKFDRNLNAVLIPRNYILFEVFRKILYTNLLKESEIYFTNKNFKISKPLSLGEFHFN